MISQNLYHHLINRASGWHPRGQRHPSASQYLNYQREFYKSITPSLTIQNVDKPLVYLRKFTPDGQLLLGFSYDQCHLEVFKYQGVGYVMDLLLTQQGECVTASDSSLYSLHIRQCIFERMLKRVYCLRLVKQSGPFKSHINREFSAFFRDEQTILKIFPKNSVQLLYILRNFCDDFRNVRSLQNQLPSSSPNNNVYFRAAFDLAISSIPGGQLEAASRFNSTLPITSQSFSTSPYLDYSLFNYDDRLISAWERPKVNILTPICFRDRIANDIKFRLFLETSFKNGQRATEDSGLRMSQRELVTFIFHPYEPFIISIQKVCRGYTINFHIYNKRSRFKVQIPYNIVYKI
ncbi:uncharacterized protein ACN2A1_013070 isoform 2-T2 [Glossina fuscipes fuscipes]